MNKRLHYETGKCLFEKRGLAWALTRFAFDSHGAIDDEVEEADSEGDGASENLAEKGFGEEE